MYAPSVVRRPLLLLALSGLLLSLTACAELDEDLRLDPSGGGTYRVRISWDQDLLRQVAESVPRPVVARFAARLPPLDAATWRDTVAGVPGLRLVRAEDLAPSGGRRGVEVEVAFDDLSSLLGWEPFARRPLVVARRGPDGSPAPEGPARAGDVTTLEMDPLVRIPLLDGVADALRRVADGSRGDPRAGPAPGTGTPPAAGAAAGDLDDLGLDPSTASLLARIVRARLDEAHLVFRVTTPGAVRAAPGARERGDRQATFTFGAERLGTARDRRLSVSWEAAPSEGLSTLRHAGDAPVPEACLR